MRTALIYIAIIITIITTIYLIWGIGGLAITFFIIAFIAISIASGILKSGDGCANFLIYLVIAFIFGITGYVCIHIESKIETEKRSLELYETIKRNPSIDQCERYLSEYKATKNANNVRQILLDQLVDNIRNNNYASTSSSTSNGYTQRRLLEKLSQFADDNQSNKFGKVASSHISSICDSLYNIAKKTATITGWITYQQVVPSSFLKDSEKQIEEIENRKWNTESKAWSTARRENTISAYKKYIRLYPNGAHYTQADRNLIDLEVASIYAGDHRSLPSMDKTSWGSGPTANVSVTNETSYTLTVLYSGPHSKRLVIPSGQTYSISLKNGEYKVAASVNANNVRDYAGIENLNGGSYSVKYYISTTNNSQPFHHLTD